MNYAKKELLHIRLMPENADFARKLAAKKGWPINIAIDFIIAEYQKGAKFDDKW